MAFSNSYLTMNYLSRGPNVTSGRDIQAIGTVHNENHAASINKTLNWKYVQATTPRPPFQYISRESK